MTNPLKCKHCGRQPTLRRRNNLCWYECQGCSLYLRSSWYNLDDATKDWNHLYGDPLEKQESNQQPQIEFK